MLKYQGCRINKCRISEVRLQSYSQEWTLGKFVLQWDLCGQYMINILILVGSEHIGMTYVIVYLT